MALCDVCGNFDDGHIEEPTKMFPSNKTALPDYKPDLYYYWDSPLDEDYDWRDEFPDVDCMCEICFDIANSEKKIKWKTPRCQTHL